MPSSVPASNPTTRPLNDPAKLIASLIPDPEQRSQIESLLADLIVTANEVNPASWGLTARSRISTLRLNVGQVVAFQIVGPGPKVGLVVPTELPDSSRMALETLDGPRPYRAHTGFDYYQGSLANVLEALPLLKASCVSATRQIAGLVKRTGFYQAHTQASIEYLSASLGRALPNPRYVEHGLSRTRLERALQLVNERYPEWSGFEDERFLADEVTYKRKASELARELLSEDELSRLITASDHEEILKRIRTVAHKTNLLYNSVPARGDLSILEHDGLDKAAFCNRLFGLLYGSGDGPTRLARYVDWVEAQGLPNKWTFPTYLLFLVHPESEFFIKPSHLKRFTELLGFDQSFRGRPTEEAYAFVLDLARQLESELATYQPADMIDLQGFLWVVSRSIEGKQKSKKAEEGDSDSEDSNSNESDSSDSDSEDPSTMSVENALFTPRTFELLRLLHANPVKETYHEHKDDIRTYVEQPLRTLLERVAARLPESILERMETEKGILSKILKNDYGRGGAWDFLWGAFYPKGDKRTSGAQLFIVLGHDCLDFGFGLGDHAGPERKRITRYFSERPMRVSPTLQSLFGKETLLFGAESTADGSGTTDWMAWSEQIASLDSSIRRRIPTADVLRLAADELIDRVVELFEALFPLILVAVESDPSVAISDYFGESDELDTNPEYSLEECAAETGFELQTLERWVRALARKRQAILYGPPGTGKTFIAERLARHLIGGGTGTQDLVQFHPSYAYEDFIQGIRPTVDDNGSVAYEMVPGRLLEFCDEARRRKDTCVLIIDEINRANLSRVFGELMYLLEYRDQEIPLAGGRRRFSIPRNVRIIGTMNTADRSIALVDHALRRRFAFLELRPDFTVLRRFHETRSTGYSVEPLLSVLKDLNHAIADPNYEVGVTFFLREDLTTQIEDIWRMEIHPYLEEYFFDRPDRLEKFSWNSVRERFGL